jgi:hypothetical protein
MKMNDLIIYGCVIVGAGIGLLTGNAFQFVLIGLGVGFLLQYITEKSR